ncbi:hypothetical protein [Mycobacterium avium]|uniref:hypothetical protein n=1 Tax=Mycobacterium avium TaxID=1764 RepID=UPI001CC765AD|nr:hypothetical protein [Mycobacterium avium]MBZ4521861.1 hypothetical protein [Mycobacterium avium subsp. hominissuis]MBZ4531244.1 hypothetical protein [Mycobacterium avium subsp. hominissuis]
MDKPSSVIAQSNKQLAVAFLDGLTTGDKAALRMPLAEDAVLVLPRPTFTGTVIAGANDIAAAVSQLSAH